MTRKHQLAIVARECVESAFPYTIELSDQRLISPGLTKREWFAGLAMQGMISGMVYARAARVLEIGQSFEGWDFPDEHVVRDAAYRLADAMLAEPAKEVKT